MSETTQQKIKRVGKEIIDLLIEKNQSYGDSALNPAGIFSSGDPIVNLGSRIDDKLMRIKEQGFKGYGEDNVKDLIGYLILLKIALEDQDESIPLKEWQKDILLTQNNNYYKTTLTNDSFNSEKLIHE
jgi:hypothetical protein